MQDLSSLTLHELRCAITGDNTKDQPVWAEIEARRRSMSARTEAIFGKAAAAFGEMADAHLAYRTAKNNDAKLISLRAELGRLSPPITAGGFDGFLQAVGKLHNPAAGRIAELREAIRRREVEIHREHFPAAGVVALTSERAA